MQSSFKTALLIGVVVFTAACSSHHKKFQDNTALEKPPTLEIIPPVANNEPINNEHTVDTGLGDAVKLEDASHLHLKQPFEQAWNTLETVLEFNSIEITDRNREKGEYFITYDPDNVKRKDSALLEDIGFFLFKDEYAESPYKITLTKKEQSVTITAEKRDSVQMDLLDDGEDLEFDDANDNGANKLIRHLYNTLKNDLPLD